MRRSIGRWMALIVLMLSVTACAQTPPASPTPPRPPAPAAAPVPPKPPQVAESPYQHSAPDGSPSLEGMMMPSERIDKAILLDDEMEAIRRELPNFNCVIVRDPGVARNYPTIPAMTLKNITLGQFLQFIQASFPGVQYKRLDGPSGSLYAIRIRMEDDPMRRAWAIDRSRVRLFRLNEFINTLADENPVKDKPREEKVKEATAQVLSLLQAALEQTDDSEPCTVKIHEPTLTLMFKGGPEKQAVLEEALSALMPGRVGKPSPSGFFNRGPKGNFSLKDMDLDLNDLTAVQAAEADARSRGLRAQSEQLQEQLSELRAQKRKMAPAPAPASQKSKD